MEGAGLSCPFPRTRNDFWKGQSLEDSEQGTKAATTAHPAASRARHEAEGTPAVQNTGIQTKSVNMETCRGAAHIKTKQHSHRPTGLSRKHFSFGWS